MCGFIAFFSDDSGPEPRFRDSRPWLDLLRHRGPDAQASHVEEGAALHFARLSILDLSPAGMQPMISASGRHVLAANGEIVNHRDLARRFSLRLRGHSDTEVLLEAAERLGPEVGRELRGMFSFVLYDRRDRSVLALRDPFGIKPLYYALENGTLILSSEIRPLLRALGGSGLDAEAILLFLRRGEIDDGEGTLFRKVRQLSPGHRLRWKDGALRIDRYRDDTLPDRGHPEPPGEGADPSRYGELLVRTVGEYLQADMPVGVGLSGGFDSSLLAHLVRENRPAPADLHMFTRGYLDYEGNELDAARQVGERFGFRFHPVILRPDEVPSLLLRCSAQQEHPVTSLSVLAYHRLYEQAREAGVKVLLEGHGGDEIWAGYASYAQADGQGRSHDGSSFELNDAVTHGAQRPVGGARINPGTEKGADAARRMEEAPCAGSWIRGELSPLARRQVADLFGAKLQRSLRFVDRASMGNGIEVRVPYLDTEVTLPALGWPDRWKVSGGHLRTRIRQIARARIGDETALRPKVPIQDPQRKWFLGELAGFVGDLLHSRPLFIESYVDVPALTRYYEQFKQTPDRFGNLTFLAFPLFLEAWHRALRESLVPSQEVRHEDVPCR